MTKFWGSRFGRKEDCHDVFAQTEFDDYSFEDIRKFRYILHRGIMKIKNPFTGKPRRFIYRFDE